MSKKILFFIILFAGVLVFSSLSLAKQIPTASPIQSPDIKGVRTQTKPEIKNLMKAKVKEEASKRKAELKEKLQGIRDEQKKKRVERVDQQLNELNERMMKHFSEVLDKLDKVLVNIKSRTDKAEAKGLNVSSVRPMIKSAEDAIAAAKAAVVAQSGKTYTPRISGQDRTLKVEVGQARKALHRDLETVREKVKLAREAVHRVATTLAQIRGVNDGISPSPRVSPTCVSRPACLDAQPPCLPPVPPGGWCPTPTPAGTVTPTPSP